MALDANHAPSASFYKHNNNIDKDQTDPDHSYHWLLTDFSSLFVQEVARFLDTKHEGHYKVYNLCSKCAPPFLTCTVCPFVEDYKTA